MFLEGYRPLTQDEIDERMVKHEETADELSLEGEARSVYLDAIRNKVQQELLHVNPVINKVRKI